MPEPNDNMKLWNSVATTDVDHTKQVSFGRRFTAIDAHYQIMEATQQFGPAGLGWGYENEYGETHLTDGRAIAWCDVTFWWHSNPTLAQARHTFGPIRGSAMLVTLSKDGKLMPDTDAYKKASTDGLTKLLSHLGFNADVFLGMFDDNKYVQDLKRSKTAEATAKEKAYYQDRKIFIDKIKSCKTADDIDAVLMDKETWMSTLPLGTAAEMRTWALKRKAELDTEEKDGS